MHILTKKTVQNVQNDNTISIRCVYMSQDLLFTIKYTVIVSKLICSFQTFSMFWTVCPRFPLSVSRDLFKSFRLLDWRNDLAKSRDDLRLCQLLECRDIVPRPTDWLSYSLLKFVDIVERMRQRVHLDVTTYNRCYQSNLQSTFTFCLPVLQLHKVNTVSSLMMWFGLIWDKYMAHAHLSKSRTFQGPYEAYIRRTKLNQTGTFISIYKQVQFTLSI